MPMTPDRVLAALDGAQAVEEQHISMATLLSLAPRATVMPAPEDQVDDPPPPPEENDKDDTEKKSSEQGQLEDQVLDAIAATP